MRFASGNHGFASKPRFSRKIGNFYLRNGGFYLRKGFFPLTQRPLASGTAGGGGAKPQRRALIGRSGGRGRGRGKGREKRCGSRRAGAAILSAARQGKAATALGPAAMGSAGPEWCVPGPAIACEPSHAAGVRL